MDTEAQLSPLAHQVEKFKYISFTAPEFRTDVEGLIASQSQWTAIESRTVAERPYREFFGTTDRLARSLALGAIPDVPAGRDITERIAGLLLEPRLSRSTAEEFFDPDARNLDRIGRAVGAGEPVRIVLPSFPGRPHNLATHRRVAPDLSEAAALARLALIAQRITAIYPPSVIWVIVLDGIAYAPFYGYALEGARQYPRDLRSMIHALGYSRHFELLDLQALIDERRAEYDGLRGEVVAEVEAQWSDPEYLFRDDLIRSMRLGTDTSAAASALIQIMKQGNPRTGLDAVFDSIDEAVSHSARRTAFEYMVMLTTIKRMDIILDKVPGALRGTLHPKPGQIAPRLTQASTDIAPWHGVATVDADGAISTVYESFVYQHVKDFTAVYVEGDYEPFYFESRRC